MSSLKIKKKNSSIIISSKAYEVSIIPEKLLVLLQKGPEFYYGMCMLSAVDMPGKKDKAGKIPTVKIKNTGKNSICIDLISDSNLWERKIHHYVFKENEIEYFTEIWGKGQVERAYYFRGSIGENEFASIPGFTQVFSPQANFIEKQEFHVSEYHSIGAGDYKEAREKIWGFALHGGPLCFVCHEGEKGPFLSAGILAKPGEYNFNAFEINYLSEKDREKIHDSIIGTEAFSLSYDGHLKIDGKWESPKLLLSFAATKKSALKQYLHRLERYGGTIKRELPYPEWAFEPVFCTWHEQVALGMKKNQRSNIGFQNAESSDDFFEKLTQKNCLKWLSLLEKNKIFPGTIILDAKWQKNVGDPVADEKKFPDLRSFVDECHARKIRVILWHNGWDRSGVPDDECCFLDGKAFKVDPANPAYRDRVKKYMERLLSDKKGSYNADGLKVDGMTESPVGAGLKNYGSQYGFEYARTLLELLYKEAKAVKADSAIGQYTAFPYFGDLCDFARTGDLYSVKGDPNSANRFRAMLQELVMPGAPIDTDGALRFNYVLPDKDVLAVQEEIGAPCLYQAEYLIRRRNFCPPDIQVMDKEKYKMIFESWKRYRKNLRAGS